MPAGNSYSPSGLTLTRTSVIIAPFATNRSGIGIKVVRGPKADHPSVVSTELFYPTASDGHVQTEMDPDARSA